MMFGRFGTSYLYSKIPSWRFRVDGKSSCNQFFGACLDPDSTETMKNEHLHLNAWRGFISESWPGLQPQLPISKAIYRGYNSIHIDRSWFCDLFLPGKRFLDFQSAKVTTFIASLLPPRTTFSFVQSRFLSGFASTARVGAKNSKTHLILLGFFMVFSWGQRPLFRAMAMSEKGGSVCF